MSAIDKGIVAVIISGPEDKLWILNHMRTYNLNYLSTVDSVFVNSAGNEIVGHRRFGRIILHSHFSTLIFYNGYFSSEKEKRCLLNSAPKTLSLRCQRYSTGITKVTSMLTNSFPDITNRFCWIDSVAVPILRGWQCKNFPLSRARAKGLNGPNSNNRQQRAVSMFKLRKKALDDCTMWNQPHPEEYVQLDLHFPGSIQPE